MQTDASMLPESVAGNVPVSRVRPILKAMQACGPTALLSMLDTHGQALGDWDVAIEPLGLAQCVQAMYHEANRYGMDVVLEWLNSIHTRNVILSDGKRGMIYLELIPFLRFTPGIELSATHLLHERWWSEGLCLPSPAAHFEYYFVKRALKGRMDKSLVGLLAELHAQAPAACAAAAHRWLPDRLAAEFLSDLGTPTRWTRWTQKARQFKRAVLRRSWSIKGLSRRFRYWADEAARTTERLVWPSGLCVALVGPDGVGKTTVMRQLAERAGNLFRTGSYYCHWRPSLWRELERRVPAGGLLVAHPNQPTGLLTRAFSIGRLAYSLVGFVTGYWTRIYPAKIRTGLVLLDRYCYPYLIRPDSVRYHGPGWIAKLALKAVPKPDITLILRAPAESIRARKPELGVDEINYQLAKFSTLAQSDPRAVEINASGSLEDTEEHCFQALVRFLAARTSRRLGRRFGYRVLSVDGVERLAIPVGGMRQMRSALRLHTPVRHGRRFLYRAMSVFPRAALSIVGRPAMSPGERLGDFDMRSWLHGMSTQMAVSDLRCAFLYPQHPARSRVGILLMNALGAPVAFAKLAWDNEGRTGLLREAEALRFVDNLAMQSFLAPRLTAMGQFESRAYNLYSTLPPGAKPTPHGWCSLYSDIWHELRTKTTKNLRLTTLNWWPRVRELGGPWSRIAEEVEQAEPTEGYEFCAAHGDFAPWNAKYHQRHVWLFDWEQFSEKAPALLDPLHFEMRRRTLVCGHPLDSVARELPGTMQQLIGKNKSSSECKLVFAFWKVHGIGLLTSYLDGMVGAMLSAGTR